MIVVTAPTGNIGRQLLPLLLESRKRVRVIARDPSRIPTQTRQRVEVVQGSHGDPEVVNKAFSGADSVIWLLSADPQAPSAQAAFVDFTRPACYAFKAHHIKHVVGVYALGRDWPRDTGYVSASLAMDDLPHVSLLRRGSRVSRSSRRLNTQH